MTFKLRDRVMSLTTSTGTGALDLSGTITGYRGIEDVYDKTHDSFFYHVYAVDSSGNILADWETGFGHIEPGFSSGYRIFRDAVFDSSVGEGVGVDFSAGTKRIVICMPAYAAEACPSKLTAKGSGTTTIYVNSSGSKANKDGLEYTRSVPTLSAALDILNARPSAFSGDVTISIAAGNRDVVGIDVGKLPKSISRLTIFGDASTILTSGLNIYGYGWAGQIALYGVKINATDSNPCVLVNGKIDCMIDSLTFGSCSSQHVLLKNGATASLYNNILATGGTMVSHIRAETGSRFSVNYMTVKTPSAFSQAAFVAMHGAIADLSVASYSHANGYCTGPHHDVQSNAVLIQPSGNLITLTAGTTSNGGTVA